MTTNVSLGFVAAAGGTVDVITATYSPAPSALVDKMLLWFRATGANTSTTPTFSPNGLTARTIVKQGGTALVAGDIPGVGAIMEVVYDLANTRWELLNPATAGNYEPFIESYTTAQIAALVGMTERQIVYDTDLNIYKYYTGSAWVAIAVAPNDNQRVIYSASGVLASNGFFTFNPATHYLTVGALTSASTAGTVAASDVTSTHAMSAKDLTATGASIKFTALPTFDDDAAAGLGGLTVGTLYQTTGSGAAPLNVAGIVMVKQ